LNSSVSAALCQPARRRGGGSFGLDAISLQVPAPPLVFYLAESRWRFSTKLALPAACGANELASGLAPLSALLMPPSACGCVSRAQVIRYSLAKKSGVCCMCLAPRDFCTRCKVAALAVCFTVTLVRLFHHKFIKKSFFAMQSGAWRKNRC
jgi:hypothetical protein